MAINIIHKQNISSPVSMVDLGPQINWNINFMTNAWNVFSIAKGNKYYMCTCGYGDVAYSTDCKNWTIVYDRHAEGSEFHCMIFAEGKFICVGRDGIVSYIDEPTNGPPTGDWTSHQLQSRTEIVYIVYEPISGYYVCVGHSGTILYTKDITVEPDEWSKPTMINNLGSMPDATLRHIIYIPELDKFVISGMNGIILYSSPHDINTWTQASRYNTNESYQQAYYDKVHELFVFTGDAYDRGRIVYTKSLTSFSWYTSPIETFENELLQSTLYIATAGIYVTVGWNGSIFCSKELTNSWTRYYNNSLLYSLRKLTTPQQPIIHLQNIYYFEGIGIIIVGHNYVIIGSELYEPIMSVDLLDMYKSMLITSGSITTNYQNNPSNYLGFGTWTETVNSGGASYTYTYYSA